jgi:hypothetical protein
VSLPVEKGSMPPLLLNDAYTLPDNYRKGKFFEKKGNSYVPGQGIRVINN